jgi:glycerol-3-phosphate dehydrogenase (NAD(P)+)
MAAYAVLGATSWGLTLASLLARAEAEVTVLTRSAAEADSVNARRGIARLPGLVLPPQVTCEPARSQPPGLAGLVVAVPAQHLRSSLPPGPGWRQLPVLSAAKGIEHGTNLRMSQVLAQEGWPAHLIAALSGPTLAGEVVQGLPAAAVVASSGDTAAAWQRALATPFFRLYTSQDITGLEFAGAVKNVVAIAAGAAAGLGFGANTIAAIVTRGLAEITRLGVALGARVDTFLGLAGVGDLTATCFSPISRNRRLGELLATGMSAGQALTAIGEAVEGASTAPVVLELGRLNGVDVPITAQVCAVLAGTTGVRDAMSELLTRQLKAESNGL